MQNGIHRNLPASALPDFLDDLKIQAEDESLVLDIQQIDNGDGTVTVSWQVLPSGSVTNVIAAGPGTAAAPATDVHALALQAQGALTKLLQQTANQARQAIIRVSIAGVGQILEHAAGSSGQAAVTDLNDLLDQMASGTAIIGADPLTPVAGAIIDARQNISDSLGAIARGLRGGIAEAPVTPPAASDSPAGAAGSVVTEGSSTGLLRDNYLTLFDSCIIRTEHAADVQKTVDRIIKNSGRYQEVSDALGGSIPWFFVGIIHSLESSFSFTTHLHNGDPLTARTVHEPKGHPMQGNPPFSWKDSAIDALRIKKLDQVKEWTLAVMLDRLERYNGKGYARLGVNSPYLWSFSQLWTKGKFVRDGEFDRDAGSDQCGGGVILKRMVQQGAVVLSGAAKTPAADAILGHQNPKVAAVQVDPSAKAELDFPGELRSGTTDKAGARRVQEWCSFHGVPTPIDGDFGDATKRAVTLFQGNVGMPATGVVDARTWSALTAPMSLAMATLSVRPANLHEAIVAVARQHIAQKPIELGGQNRGPWVRLYMGGRDGVEQQWCAGFACYIIAQAARELDQAMPFPREVGVQALIDDAKATGRFIPGSSVATPAARVSRLKPGYLFVIKTATFSHAGLVIEVRGDTFTSAEGNTNNHGSNNGFEAISPTRNYTGRDFIALA